MRAWKTRRNRGIKILIVGSLAIFAARNAIQTYYAVTEPHVKVVQALPTQTYVPVPDSAKSVGRLFLLNWYYTAAGETAESKLDRLRPYISPTVEGTIESENVLPLTPMTPNRIELWDDEDLWIEKGKKAVLKYQVMMDDGRSFLVSVKVVKAGQWMVDSLPGLIPDQPKKTPPAPAAPSLDEEQLQEIQSALDAFFPMWMSGKSEALRRFAVDGVQIPVDDTLGQVKGTYEGVAISPVSKDPIQVRALVKVKSGQEVLPFEYLVTMEEQDGQLKIRSIQ